MSNKNRVVVADSGIYSILMEVDDYIREHMDVSSSLDMYDIPRHHPVLIAAVENYIADNPNQTHYKIVDLKSNRYSVIIDSNGYEYLIDPECYIWSVVP